MLDAVTEAWRAASRAADLAAFVASLAQTLGRRTPSAWLSLWQLDAAHGSLTCLAAADPRGPRPPLAALPLTDAGLKRAQTWLRRGEIAVAPPRRHEGGAAVLVQALPESTAAVIAALPLADGAGTSCVAFLEGGRIDGETRRLLAGLAEPFAAALAHDRRLLELRALRDAAAADREALLRRLGREHLSDQIVGAEAGLGPVLERVRIVAGSDLPVLLFGETGAGKEVVARAVHEQSARRAHPFIRVNCGAIPPDLIDSELFGHQRGAFTGAIADRAGWFEQADTGTLFLDEIGDLPLPAQVRLLRVLQDGTLQRVGGHQPLKVDVRIVAATHRDLPSLVERGEFRADLWYRLASFPIVLPPLRERREDIPALAEHFVRRAARRFGLARAALTPHDLERLAAYDWPGNVRELASVIDRAVIVGQGDTLAIETALGSAAPSPRAPRTTGAPASNDTNAPGDDSLDAAMRRHIESVLRRTRGTIEGPRGAAMILRINPHTLRARMRKLGVTWSRFREPD